MPPFVARKQRRSPTPPSRTGPTKSPPLKSSIKKPSLFDTIDTKPTATHSLGENQAFLDSLGGSSDQSSLSEYESSDFEDVHPLKRRKGDSNDHDSDEEEDIDWEDAVAPGTSIPITPGPDPSGDLDLTLDKTKRFGSLDKSSQCEERVPARLRDKLEFGHIVCTYNTLLFHNLVRNMYGYVIDKSRSTRACQ